MHLSSHSVLVPTLTYLDCQKSLMFQEMFALDIKAVQKAYFSLIGLLREI